MKKFLAIALASVLLFALAACGGNSGEKADVVKVIDINLFKLKVVLGRLFIKIKVKHGGL